MRLACGGAPLEREICLAQLHSLSFSRTCFWSVSIKMKKVEDMFDLGLTRSRLECKGPAP